MVRKRQILVQWFRHEGPVRTDWLTFSSLVRFMTDRRAALRKRSTNRFITVGTVTPSVRGSITKFRATGAPNFSDTVVLCRFWGIVRRFVCMPLVRQVVSNRVRVTTVCSIWLGCDFMGRNSGTTIRFTNKKVIRGILCINLTQVAES